MTDSSCCTLALSGWQLRQLLDVHPQGSQLVTFAMLLGIHPATKRTNYYLGFELSQQTHLGRCTFLRKQPLSDGALCTAAWMITSRLTSMGNNYHRNCSTLPIVGHVVVNIHC